MLLSSKHIINPLSIFFPFILSFYYYQFMLSSKQSELNSFTIVTVFLFIFSYVFSYFFIIYNKSYILNKTQKKDDTIRKGYLDFVFILAFLVFMFECYMSGGFPFFIALFYRVNIYADMYHVPIAHYLVMLSAVFPCLYYHLKKNRRISNFKFYLFSFVSVFILLNIMSRQIMIMSSIFLFMVYSRENGLNVNKYVVRFAGAIAILFMVLGFIRIQSINDDVSQLDYLKAYAGVPKEREVTSFDVTFNLYTSQNISTLNDIISQSDSLGFGKYFFQSLIKIFKFDQVFSINYPVHLDSFSRLGTIVADPYLDFDVLGVMIFAFAYGVINTVLYLKYNYTNGLMYTLLWSLALFVMLMSVFTNFYNLLFTWIVAFMSIFIIKNKANLS
ncbi:O-antigen polymerase [Vibrio natriegens]|uniref:O-antigen polymerase n=1 Tax=Vibrio natriegens TaxID=691 RepID=UPI003DA1A5D0